MHRTDRNILQLALITGVLIGLSYVLGAPDVGVQIAGSEPLPLVGLE